MRSVHGYGKEHEAAHPQKVGLECVEFSVRIPLLLLVPHVGKKDPNHVGRAPCPWAGKAFLPVVISVHAVPGVGAPIVLDSERPRDNDAGEQACPYRVRGQFFPIDSGGTVQEAKERNEEVVLHVIG